MLSVARAKQLLKVNDFTDEQLEELLNTLYLLAHIVVDNYFEKRKKTK